MTLILQRTVHERYFCYVLTFFTLHLKELNFNDWKFFNCAVYFNPHIYLILYLVYFTYFNDTINVAEFQISYCSHHQKSHLYCLDSFQIHLYLYQFISSHLIIPNHHPICSYYVLSHYYLLTCNFIHEGHEFLIC